MPDRFVRYEALPPNTSLLANLAAGAFAGIMVCFASKNILCLVSVSHQLIFTIGTHRHVSRRCCQGEEKHTLQRKSAHCSCPRLACKSSTRRHPRCILALPMLLHRS